MKFSVTAKPNMPCVDEEFIVNGDGEVRRT